MRFRVRRRHRYLWVAVSRLTRQVLSFFLGDRSIASLHALWQHVLREYRRRLIYTDAYTVYSEFFGAWQHRPSPKGSGRTSVADLVQRLVLTFDQHNRLCRRRIEKLGWFTPSMQ